MKQLFLAAALLSAITLLGRSDARADDEMSGIGDLRGDERIVHVLNRMGYGPRPGDVDRVRETGIYRYIVNQLHPERISDAACEKRLEALELYDLTAAELQEAFPPPTKEERKRIADLQTKIAELRKQEDTPKATLKKLQDELNGLRRRNDRNRPLTELARAKIIRAVHSERQLEQVMADFWFNHFNVFGRKGPATLLIPELEEKVIRPHALGKFHDLLTAVAKSPAMLFYLDNWMSAAPEGAPVRRPGKRAARKRGGRRGLNENYARELLELHTVGVDNGYEQKDIIEVARCFTGWTIAGGGYRGRSFEFKLDIHDAGPKKVMGHRVRGGRGVEDGMQILEMLAHHPNTALFLSEKLCRKFVSDEPPPTLVERCAGTFLDTGGDIRMVLYRIFTSPEFFDAEVARGKIKKPHEYVVSAIRAMDLETDAPRALLYQIRNMGESLYLCEPPTGYADTAEKWAGTNAILSRVNFATGLAYGRVPGSKPNFAAILKDAPTDDAQALSDWMCRRYLGQPLSPRTEMAVARSIEKARDMLKNRRRGKAGLHDAGKFLTTLILGSPDFQMQ